ncbi:hypothetical protein ACHWQZ_G011525 [Mnemiopsis leidyi]
MSKVGVCRIMTVVIIILFTLSVLGYSQYYLTSKKSMDQNYHTEALSIAMKFVLPGVLVFLYFLLLSNYLLCIIIKPQQIPEQYNLTTAEIAQFMIQPNSKGSYQALATLTRDYVKARPDLQVRERDYRHGGLRICERCSIIKPDRSHHCGICNRCVLRMDHHCHWVNNCIHEGNHKYFIQCITTACLICVVTIIHYSINIACSACKEIPSADKVQLTVCALLYSATGLSLLISLFMMFLTLDHCTNLFRGQTSYERVYDRDHYNRGWKKNFRDVMGQNLLQWLCPIAPSKLTAEQEPLIVTVTEQSSNNWKSTPDSKLYTQYYMEEKDDSSPSRHSRHSTSSEERTVGVEDEYGEETLSLHHGQSGQTEPGLVARVRTPSSVGDDK